MTRSTTAAGLAFASGVAVVYLLPGLPPLAPIGLVIVAFGLAAWRWRLLRLPFWLMLGAFWAHWNACLLLCSPFPDALARAPLVVEGRIASIPTDSGLARRFLFEVERARHEGEHIPFTGLVRLSWYDDAPPLRAGEQWRLPVRLKPRHGFANPGTFDFERWLFEQGVQATGNLRRGEPPQRLDAGAGRYWLDRRRQGLAEHLARVLDGAPALPLVQALVIGDRSGFDQDDWEVMTRTGTNHLVAISGLHVGLIAGAVFFLVRWLWSRSAGLTAAFAAPRAAAVGGMIAALGYAGLAGFAVSTQRALVMIAVVFAALVWQRTLRPYHALVLALVGVLLVDPGAVLSPGFWLSFGAVAVLLFSLGHRLPSRALWTRWGRAQWAVGIGLLPLLFLLFGRASLIAPPVNLVAVPLFSLILLPLVLVTSLLSLLPGVGAVSAWPLQWTAHLLGWCLDGLAWIAALPWAAMMLPERPLWVWLAAGAGAALMLAPRGLPGRWLGLLLVVPMFALRTPHPGDGEAWFTLLDVGLGLSAVVRTREGTLLYDTGPGFPSGFDTGSAVVAPFLAAQGVRRIERLVVSHADRDHAGGLAGLAKRIPIDRIDSGEPARLGVPGVEPCRAGEGWDWSGVSFRFIHPPDAEFRGNDASCVLRVETGGRSILLTGDIQARVERRLARAWGDALASDVLVAGHHGSATSTHPAFLDTVAPGLVLFASGYANHFGFPVAEVRERVSARGIPALDTGLVGAIELRLGSDGTIEGPWTWRERTGRFWTHRADGYPNN
ncbi:MAG: DNA internalization-related competence protein ComEC/Rec2 [Thiocapsa sp.]|uniref:DNA internalization-related competence protein ComEC/Rec2 n=1 Tax=Thiocapsa sp. TaxID=2024551 RepID=UPI001BCE9AAA|nr:DNA internalization-related competence protein ComEC/Rec2 [Thiocapsa sp.]QVL48413.1 MAG: DNA internalization-related competence protein ComEC/Rec2 [Thiocapsa sp.]